MTRQSLERGISSLITRKMNSDYECSIEDKDIKETFFIKSYDNGQTYHLYRGCNLVVGDVPSQYIVASIADIHQQLTSETRMVSIAKWGGRASVFVINSLDLIPEGSRYICSTDSGDLDIYETEQGVVYGVVA